MPVAAAQAGDVHAEKVSDAPAFYLSNAGSDDADGLTPDTAWRTLSKASTVLPRNGSVLLLRRGDTFYGELVAPFGCEVGAYGDGERPILTKAKLLNRPEGWVADRNGIWKIDIGSPDTHDGFSASPDANIGFLMVDGTVKPTRKVQLADLDAAWDFWCDTHNNILYVAACANPTSLASEIRAVPRGNTSQVLLCGSGANDIHDLHITEAGGHGITGAGVGVHIHDCLIDYIGGAYLPDYGDGTVRYGNGIEIWIGATNWLVEDNEIAQTYDVAFTCQGNAYDTARSWRNLTVRSNHIHNCTQSFEFWSTGTNIAAGFKNILIENNLCQEGGYSAFADVRPNQATRVHLLTYNWDLPADITMQNNTFEDVYAAYCYHSVSPDGLVTRDNVIRYEPNPLTV